MTLFILNFKVLACTALDNLTWLLDTDLFSLLFLPTLGARGFFLFRESGTFSNRERSLFYPRNFENGPLEPWYFLSWHLKLLTSEIQLRIYWFVDTKNYLQFCCRSSWGFSPFWLLFFYLHIFQVKSIKPNSPESKTITLFCFNLKKLWLLKIFMKIKHFLVQFGYFATNWSGTGNKS